MGLAERMTGPAAPKLERWRGRGWKWKERGRAARVERGKEGRREGECKEAAGALGRK